VERWPCTVHRERNPDCRVCHLAATDETYRALLTAFRPAKPRLPKGVPHCPGCAQKRQAAQSARLSDEPFGAKKSVSAPPAFRVNDSLSPRQMADVITAKVGGWPEGWAGWDVTREAHLLLMRERVANAPERCPGRGGGRGIVVNASGKPGMSSGKHLPNGYFPGAWVLARELRRLGCTLPITFAYLGELEWDPIMTRLVEPLGVQVLDLRAVEEADPRRPRILAGWESKCYSILHSPYDEVLYLDADQIPLKDPTYLFESKQYRYHGAVFWPDVPPEDRPEWLPVEVWDNVGLEYRDEVDFESGQLLIDKTRCHRELDLAMWMNEHSDWFYRFIFGDKSTFHLAWAVLGSNYAMPARGPGGNQASLVQHDFSGQHLFQHLTRNKPSLAGWPSPGSLLRRAECEPHLEELRGLWSGRLWHQPDPSPQEEAWRLALEGRVFTYERGGLESRPLRFLEDGAFGRGRARKEFGWAVWDEGGAPLLVVLDLDGCPTMTLRPDGAGGWAGRWLEHERCPARLVPAGDARGAA
jgi:hypothetical protein